MSLPRLIVLTSLAKAADELLTLDEEHARHLQILRLRPGAALEILLPSGPWRADLTELDRRRAQVRLVAPLEENREAPVSIQALLPITAQLSLWDDFLPGVVELGASLIQPVIYARSEYDSRRTAARMERWQRIVLGAVEQSHRSRIPELRLPLPLEHILDWPIPQKWVASELRACQSNPALGMEAIAFTHGPEGGLTDIEHALLGKHGWRSISLGKSILRAATCPWAILGAIQAQLGLHKKAED